MAKNCEKWVYEKPKKKGETLDECKENMETIERLASLGLSIEQIANYFGLAGSTLRNIYHHKRWIQQSFTRGKSKGVAAVASELFKQIKNGNTTATIFYLKTHAGWNDEPKKDLGGDSENDKPKVTINVSDPIEAARLYQEIMRGEK